MLLIRLYFIYISGKIPNWLFSVLCRDEKFPKLAILYIYIPMKNENEAIYLREVEEHIG